MKIVVVLGAVLALAGACKKKETAAPSTGSAGSGSGSPVAAAPADAAAPDGPEVALPAVLELDDVDAEAGDESLPTAFNKKAPRLPAISADGTLVANYDHAAGMPSIPMDATLVISEVATAKRIQELPVVTPDESMKWQANEDNWLTPAVKKTLQTRGAAIMKRLEGFHSLARIPTEDDKPTKIGDLTLKVDGELTFELADASGKMIHRATVDSFSEGNRGEGFENAACTFTPVFSGAYRDPARPSTLWLEVDFKWQEGCIDPLPHYIVWSLDPNSTTPAERMAVLVGKQFDLVGVDDSAKLLAELATADAMAITKNTVAAAKDLGTPGPPEAYEGHDDGDLTIVIARDGKSAWASTQSGIRMPRKGEDNVVYMRASNLFVDTPQGWRIAALAWSEPTDNALANKDSKSGALKPGKLTADPGDASLNAAFAKLTTDGASNVAKDLVAFGSGPDERTVGAPAFTKPWNAAWKGKTTIVSSVARLAPSGTTGWVAATVELQKKGYKIPFTVFAVFDKDAGGAWTLVHIHFSV